MLIVDILASPPQSASGGSFSKLAVSPAWTSPRVCCRSPLVSCCSISIDLYPGLTGSGRRTRRLVVSVTCMFVVWAWPCWPAVRRVQLWFLVVVYPACMFTLPIARTGIRVLGRNTRWVTCTVTKSGIRQYLENIQTGAFRHWSVAMMRPPCAVYHWLAIITTWGCGR